MHLTFGISPTHQSPRGHSLQALTINILVPALKVMQLNLHPLWELVFETGNNDSSESWPASVGWSWLWGWEHDVMLFLQYPSMVIQI
jgi:hypothetical protein